MGQKIHPLSLRVQSSTRHFDHAWYSDYFFSKLITIDLSIFRYLNTFLKILKLPSGRFSIYHLSKTTKLYSFFCYPQQSREYRAKIFNIPSGLISLKTKNAKGNPFSKRFIQDGITNPTLFQKLTSLTNINKKSLISIDELLVFKSIKLQKTFDKNFLQTNYKSLYQNLSKENKNLYRFIDSFDNTKSLVFNKKIVDYLGNSYNSPQNHFFKNNQKHFENEKILSLFKNFLFTSKTLQMQYSLFFKNNEKLNNCLVESQLNTSFKYNRSLETHLSNFINSDVSLIPFRISSEWQDAGYIADEIVYLLERRIGFRQIKNRLIRQFVENPHIQGVRITCSGRVGGKSKKAQRAKIETIKYGQTSLHIFSSQIDFAVRTAHTPLGSTGIKIWVCYK